MRPDILFATVLMERNRWAPAQRPAVAVSPWLAELAQAGFDGIELWQRHAVEAAEAERERLADAPLPVAVFSAYVGFTGADAPLRERVATLVRRFKSRAVKFNLSHRVEDRADEIAEARRWFASMPGVTPLCECHEGSSVEHAADAAAAFADWPELRVIVHPFTTPPETLQAWVDALGPRIGHCHVQARLAGPTLTFSRLDEQADWVAAQTRRLRRGSSPGSWSIEFTRGVATPDETPGSLVAAAVQDLHTLRGLLA